MLSLVTSRRCSSAPTLRRPAVRPLLAALAPVALVLHEAAYLLARTGQCCEESELTLPMTIAVSILVGGVWSFVLAPLVGRIREDRRSVAVPIVISLALVTIFISQEAMEGLALQSHPAIAQTTIAIVAPLVVLVAVAGTMLARLIYRTVAAIVAIVPARIRSHGEVRSPNERDAPVGPPITAAPLAFGLARRPPPPVAQS